MAEISSLTPYLIFGAILFVGSRILCRVLKNKMLDRWKKTPKDLVILHGQERAYGIPCASPFVLKLETYLRMANIPYKYDTKDSMGPKEKCPWISINGEHIGDTKLIIQFLAKKFEKNLNGSYSDEKLAVATAVRVMLEEHFFWGLAAWYFVFDGRDSLTSKIKLPSPAWLSVRLIRRRLTGYLWAHGLGRHSEPDIHSLMITDLRATSKILGDSQFLLGKEPSEADAAVFGFVAQLVWGPGAGSPESKVLLDELPNLKEYCYRMKEKYWPDWDNMLAK